MLIGLPIIIYFFFFFFFFFYNLVLFEFVERSENYEIVIILDWFGKYLR